MRVLKLSFLFMVAMLTSGCPNKEDINEEVRLSIYNHSDKDIYYELSVKDPIYYSYPPVKSSFIPSKSFFSGKDAFRQVLRDGNKMYIWLFDKEVIDTTSWEEVVGKDLYLIRYDLTLKDLEEMNWTITYEGE